MSVRVADAVREVNGRLAVVGESVPDGVKAEAGALGGDGEAKIEEGALPVEVEAGLAEVTEGIVAEPIAVAEDQDAIVDSQANCGGEQEGVVGDEEHGDQGSP